MFYNQLYFKNSYLLVSFKNLVFIGKLIAQLIIQLNAPLPRFNSNKGMRISKIYAVRSQYDL